MELVKVIDPLSIEVSRDLLKHTIAMPFSQRVKFIDILVQSHDYNAIHLKILEEYGPEDETRPMQQPDEFELYYETYHAATCTPLSFYPAVVQNRLATRFVRTWPMLWQLYCRHKHIKFGPYKCQYHALQRAIKAFRDIDSKINHLKNITTAIQLMMDKGYTTADLFSFEPYELLEPNLSLIHI